MSIQDELDDLARRRMLFPLQPMVPGDTAYRVMLVGEELWNLLESPEGDLDWEQRIGELRADLEVFVTARTISPKYLFLLYPAADAVWEIRSVRPSPGIRVFSMFALKDVLIAADCARRDQLGSWQSRLWKQMKRNARAAWRRLFPSYDPIVTTDVSQVVTGAEGGKFFK